VASNPLNLALRFLLELAALVALGAWGWRFGGVVGAALVPLVAAAAWATFNVKGDPSRSGKAPVAVPGVVRLLVEAAFFAAAVYGTYAGVARPRLAVAFAAVVVAHYAISYDRIAWLVRR
jgi:hypothetical protein